MNTSLKVSQPTMVSSFDVVLVQIPIKTEMELPVPVADQEPIYLHQSVIKVEAYMNQLEAYMRKLTFWLFIFSAIALLALIAAGYLYFIAERVEYLALMMVFFGTFGNAIVLAMKIINASRLANSDSNHILWHQNSTGSQEPFRILQTN